MDMAVLISLVVMILVSAAEVLCLFFCSKLRTKRTPVAAVIPIFGEDGELEEKLQFMLSMTERGASPVDRLLLVNISGSEAQLAFCRDFCRSCCCAEIIPSGEIEKKLSEIFAIPAKT